MKTTFECPSKAIRNYNPPINFRVISLATFRHVVQKSLDNYRAISPVCIDICPVSEKKQSHRKKSFDFFYPETDILFFLFKFRKIRWKNTNW